MVWAGAHLLAQAIVGSEFADYAEQVHRIAELVGKTAEVIAA